MTSRSPSTVTSVVSTLCLGVLFGLIILSVVELETRWLLYIAVALVFAVVLVVIREQERFLWGVLVLSLQIGVYLRFLYGRVGGDGISLSLPFLIAMAIVGWYLISGNFHRIQPIKWGGRLAIPIAAVFATSFLSVLVTSEKFIGIAHLLIYFQYYVLYLIAFNCITTEKQFERTLKLLVLMLTIQSIVYFIQSTMGITFTLTGEVRGQGQLPRPGGTVATNPAGFASFVLPLMLIAIALSYLPGSSIVRAWKMAVPALLGMMAILLTYTRAAWGSAVIGISCLVILSYRRNALPAKKIVMVGVLAVIVGIVSTPMVLTRLEDAPLKSSYDERAALMQMAIEVIKSEPVLGVGPGAYRYMFKHYLSSSLREKWLFTVHNQYLLQTAETGILGGVAFVLFLVAGLRQALRVSRSSQPTLRAAGIGCSAGILALCFEMYWDAWIGFPYNALLWFLFGLMGAAETLDKRSVDIKS